MAEFLLELLSEEIPAGMQGRAEGNLQSLIYETFKSANLERYIVKPFSTPRRLAVYIDYVADTSKDSIEERKGPRIDAPQQALDGFLRSCGMEKEDLKIEEDKKGKFYVAEIIKKGRPAEEVLAEIIPEIIRNFPWPKSMLWGDGGLRWVRPLHSILAIVIREEKTKTVNFEIGGIKSGNTTLGLFNDSEPIEISSFADYRTKLNNVGIIFDREERRNKIIKDTVKMTNDKGLKLVVEEMLLDRVTHGIKKTSRDDEALVREITGLVESPFCIMGEIDKKFLDLPTEVLQTSMRTHQKFLSVENPKTGQVEKFITVANKYKPYKSAQKTILKGNQRVLSARLADAKFFWENDLRHAKDGMKDWQAKLEKITFHNKLGTQADRVNRIAKFARNHAHLFDYNGKVFDGQKATGIRIDGESAEIVARLMKLDLCSEMVGEFPELQGIMGGYYAKEAGYDKDICRACTEHYKPLGEDDAAPRFPLSVVVAVADKLDTLAGFWSIGQKPTGSKDPFALRRAALGVIRMIVNNEFFSPLPLFDMLGEAFDPFIKDKDEKEKMQKDLLNFFHERLKIYLRMSGIREEYVDACILGNRYDDFAFIEKLSTWLWSFCAGKEGKDLLQGFKRAHNILHAEQKKDGVFYEMPPEPQYFQDPTETELHEALNAAEHALPPLMEKEQFAQMLQTLANLRAPIDAFFTQVQVNSDQSAVRRNRLCLLHKLCSVMKTFADFSRLNG